MLPPFTGTPVARGHRGPGDVRPLPAATGRPRLGASRAPRPPRSSSRACRRVARPHRSRRPACGFGGPATAQAPGAGAVGSGLLPTTRDELGALLDLFLLRRAVDQLGQAWQPPDLLRRPTGEPGPKVTERAGQPPRRRRGPPPRRETGPTRAMPPPPPRGSETCTHAACIEAGGDRRVRRGRRGSPPGGPARS